MALPSLSREEALEIDRALRRFGAANLVSVWVGIVMFPLLFGGLAIGSAMVIPAPFGTPIAGIFGGCAVLGVALMLWYRHRTLHKPAQARLATVVRPIVTEGRHGQRAYALEVQIASTHPFSHEGLGAQELAERGRHRELRLTSERLLEVVPPGHQALLVSVSTGEVVGIHYKGALHLA
jgi:hypothetical protein